MKKSVKRQLAEGELTLGSWITLGHPAIAEIMAASGFEFVVVDLEHSVIGIAEAANLIRVIDLAGASPLVRTTSNDPDQIKRVMDAGAHGVIVPMIKSAEEARRAVDAVYYPPRGTRGVGLARAQGYGTTFPEYCRWLEQEAVVIVQIEHIDAVRDLDEILSVDGVDGYIIGPYDLSASMGLAGQLDHPSVVAALRRVGEVAALRRKSGGVHLVEPDPAKLSALIDQGFTFIVYSVDFRMLDRECRAVQHLRSRSHA